MPKSHNIHVNISESEIRRLRMQLETEIAWLHRQMDEIHGADSDMDVSLLQTYKEMIFSRRALLGRIPR